MKSIQTYIDRLYNEWITHSKIIIGVDFDDTISPWKLAKDEDCQRVIKILKHAKHVGCYIVIHTACNPERYEEIGRYCEQMGLSIDTINQNPIELPYGKQNKPMCNIYIDDRAGLNESLEILQVAMYRKAGNDYENSLNDQTAI